MTKTRRFFEKSRIFASLITFVCLCVLVGTAADMSKKKVVESEGRMIELANSRVRVLLKGNESYRISLDGKSFSRELPQRHEIRLRGQVFDPLVNPPRQDISEVMASQAPGGINLYIVQCVTQAIEAYQKEITAAGGEICGTLPYHALIVAMSGETGGKVQAMSFVRWVGHYHSSYKLEPGLDDVSRMADATKTRYSLWLAKENKKNEVADFITGIGGEVVLKGKSRRMEANLDSNQLRRTAGNPWVLAVDRWTPIGEDMNIVRQISGANYLETVQGYSGQGVRGEVCDGGVRITHVDFGGNPPIIHCGNSPSTSHGTSVYGILFGDGTGDPNARGLLPDAEQPIFAAYSCIPDWYAHIQELVNPAGPYRAVFQTNSWGYTRTSAYTTISAEMDEIIFELDILICQGQGNGGNQDSRPRAWAKNIVSVGGVRHYNTLSRSDDCWCSGASIGPAADGRIKPDLWHFYDYVWTTCADSDTCYWNFGGTSGATPITAGHAGLVFQMWADGVFSGGPGLARDAFYNRPHATTAKALLIHSAYQYPFSGTSDDKTRMHQGWGMADVRNLYDMAQAHNWGFPVLIDESAVIAPLETHTYSVNVDGTQPLKATMVYADPPGVPGAGVHRINDLSLKVIAPNGTTYYWGNNGLDIGVWSTPGGYSNTIDTVENVFIQDPAVGTWIIQVLADEVVQDSHVETPTIDADYALVVSGGSGLPKVGNTQVFLGTSTSDNRQATIFTMPGDDLGLIISVTMYHDGYEGETRSMILGVYDGECSPQNRLGVTATTAVSKSPGWQTIQLTHPVFVQGGTKVWLAWVYSNNPGIRYESGSPVTADAGVGWSGGMPDPFGSSTLENNIYSIYATYIPGWGNTLKTVGNTTIFGSTSTAANRRAMPFTMPENGTIESVTMYHNGGSGSMIMGVYDGEGIPINRLGVTPVTEVCPFTYWQTINLDSPAYVAGGTTVWLAWIYSDNPGIAYQTGSPGRFQSPDTWSGDDDMPDPFGSGSQTNYIYSIYATYTPGGTPPPPPTGTVGNTTIFGSTSTAATRRAMPFTMPENGTIQSVTMYHEGYEGETRSMILGVYDGEGSPANRLGVTDTTDVNGNTGWQVINLDSPPYVAGGTTVWLAWVYSDNPGIRYESGSPGRADAGVGWSGGMPDPFGSSTQANYIYSIYATYTTGN